MARHPDSCSLAHCRGSRVCAGAAIDIDTQVSGLQPPLLPRKICTDLFSVLKYRTVLMVGNFRCRSGCGRVTEFTTQHEADKLKAIWIANESEGETSLAAGAKRDLHRRLWEQLTKGVQAQDETAAAATESDEIQASPAAGMVAEEDIAAAQSQALPEAVPGLSEMTAKCMLHARGHAQSRGCDNVLRSLMFGASGGGGSGRGRQAEVSLLERDIMR